MTDRIKPLDYLADLIPPGYGGYLTTEEKLHNAHAYNRHLIALHKQEMQDMADRLNSALDRAQAAEREAGTLRYQLSQMTTTPEQEAAKTAAAVRRIEGWE